MAHAFLKASTAVTVRQRCKKVAFPSRQLAMKAARDFRHPQAPSEHGNGKLAAYRCAICRAYHVGHLPAKGQKRKAMIHAD